MKVLIVDDETVFRDFLRHEIPWDEWGLEWAGEAKNGIEALELAVAVRPQIVFADINMPLMDGLELTAQLAQRVPDCRVVIVSAHDQFAFARQAMQLGVRHYLLKPFDPADLHKTLAELVPLVEKEERARTLEAADQKSRRNQLLSGLLDAPDPEQAAAILTEALIALPHDTGEVSWQAAVIRRGTEVPGGVPIAFFDPDGDLFLAGWESVHGPRTFEALIQKLSAQTGPVGLGLVHHGAAALTESLAEARAALARAVFFGTGPLLKFTPVSSAGADGFADEWEAHLKSLVLAATMKREQDSTTILNHLLDLLVHRSASEARARQACHLLLHRLSQTLGEQGTEAGEVFGTLNPATEIEASTTLQDLIALVRLWVERSLSVFVASGTRHTKVAVQVKKLLTEQLHDPDLSMEAIAASVGLHASSLRSIFQKETGQSVMECLLEIRMSRARELLALGHLKHSAIALEVGFSDPAYFSRCFKKVFSITPSEYEDSLSRPPR